MNDGPDDLFQALDEFLTRMFGQCDSQYLDALVDLELTFTQVRMLFVLVQHEESMSINEIATRLRLSMASTGRNVDQLMQLGLVDRREDPDDRRIKRASLTGAGRELAGEHIEAQRDVMRAFSRRLPEADRRRLYDALQPILAGESLRQTSQETRR